MELIVQSVIGLVALLVVLLFLLLIKSNKKTSINKIVSKKKSLQTNYDMENLRQIIKDKKSKTEELRKALELIIKYHGKIHPKLGTLAHPDFEPYKDVLFTVCRHPNADKNMIINFDRELGKLNPDYKKDLNEAITKGLTSRRV